MAAIIPRPFDTTLAQQLARPRTNGATLYWLGQAGFVIDTPSHRMVIDPYLSNSLEAKYRDTAYPHPRMAPAPITPDGLGPVDLVLCTHQHTDHLDGDTLSALAARRPELRFVVPRAARQIALERIGITEDRLIMADAGDMLAPLTGVSVQVMRAAHETLERDAEGHHRFLGYGLDLGSLRLFHSGDTIPYDGQADEIKSFAPDVALLPVNGRSATLRAAGFAGNLTIAEAIWLTSTCGAGTLIAHHYGMFAFNTAEPAAIDAAAATAPFRMNRAQYQIAYESVI